MTKREKATLSLKDQATLALWDYACDIDFGKSKNKVVRDMQALAFEVIVGDMKYVYLVDYSAKFIKLLTKFSNEFNQEDELRLVNTTSSDKICVFITKYALIEFSLYLLHRKDFIKKWVYVDPFGLC